MSVQKEQPHNNRQIFADQDVYKRQGFLSEGEVKPEYDWRNYIAAVVQHSYDYLTAEPDKNEEEPTMKGILHPNKDTKGLIRRKYDVLISYFEKEYNIDLQAIGNK